MGFYRQPGFMTPAECLAVRWAMDRGVVEQAEVLAGGIQGDPGVRRATLIEPDPNLVGEVEARLETCREPVAKTLGMAVADREGPGFIRYPTGGFYRAHRDRGDDSAWEGAARRAVAIVVFLNDGRDGGSPGEFDGGVLRLFLSDASVDIVPEAGLLVAFPADVLHEVTEVRGGTRDTIVDWLYAVS